MRAPASLHAALDAQRASLAGADLSGVDPALRGAAQRALDLAFAEGFRVLMLACAALSVAGALFAWALVEPRPKPARGLTAPRA